MAETELGKSIEDWRKTKEQINRYFIAVHGPSYAYRAPETFGNLLERWLLAVSGGRLEDADRYMTQIEEMSADQ